MSKFDLVIRNGTVVTIADAMCCGVGIVGEKIVELGESLADGSNEVDATNCLVLPGGIDSHCHIEQKSSAGIECADDFYTATVSAAFGGTPRRRVLRARPLGSVVLCILKRRVTTFEQLFDNLLTTVRPLFSICFGSVQHHFLVLFIFFDIWPCRGTFLP